MKNKRLLRPSLLLVLWIVGIILAVHPLTVTQAANIPISYLIDVGKGQTPISPYIYGTNQDLAGVPFTMRRLGGNRMTGFNWETNASNAGSDYNMSSDNFMCGATGVSAANCGTPGAVISAFHDKSLSVGAKDIITLQMAGYVAADENGTVSVAETAPSARWFPVVAAKGSAFAIPPSLTDGTVYMDEEVNWLVNKYGSASTANGVWAYMLDNEPALWSSTHPRIHPNQPGAAELVNRSIPLATALKAVDPNALVFGPAAYGFEELATFQNATDWPSLQGNYRWYVDYYLDQFKKASDAAGKRLLDDFDFHWYPEATGGGVRITGNGTGTIDTQKARVQAPRSLWDPTYQETSWIESCCSTFLPILPQVQQSINTYYPGTKLSISEFNYGGESDISGGLAMADVLGIFGKYGLYAGDYWQIETTTNYTASAYNLYLNYDGANSKFGNTEVNVVNPDVADSSIYASITGSDTSTLHLIVLNKSYDSPVTATFTINSPYNYTSGTVWGYDATSSTITQRTAISGISGNSFTYTIPVTTALHIILTANPTGPTNTPRPPTATNTPTFTPTATFTPCLGCGFKVQYFPGTATATTNQITPHFQIVNTNSVAVPLSDFTIRYWYTIDGSQTQQFNCDYAVVGCSNVTGTFVKLANAVSGADYYMQVGFTGTGTIAANGTSGEIQTRFNKSDFSNFTQTNDYSFDGTKTAFADWSNVTLYRNGGLVWGVEPGSGPTSTVTNTPVTTATFTATKTNTPITTTTFTPTFQATTATPTPTVTRSNTPTAATHTLTPTSAITNTPTKTFTPTNTPTRTNTPGTPTNTPSRTFTPTTGPTNTPNAGDPCASPTVITGGGSYAVSTSGTCFKYINTGYKLGGMFSVMNGATSASNTLKWYGGTNENATSCTTNTSTISGNGGQLNNFVIGKDANGQMFLTITASTGNTVSISIQNWQNGSGCSVPPTVHP